MVSTLQFIFRRLIMRSIICRTKIKNTIFKLYFIINSLDMRMTAQKLNLFWGILLIVVIFSVIYIKSKYGIWQTKVSHIFESADILKSGNALSSDHCDRDDFLDMSEYLKDRRICLLKYCGEVCNTTHEHGDCKFINCCCWT